MNKNAHAGITLIELMIVVAIIGILAAIAYPSYQRYVTDSRRADAQAALSAFANAMERHYTENLTYEGAANGGNDTGAPAAAVFRSDQVPLDGGTAYYDLTIAAADNNSFELQAQATGVQDGDGDLRITQTGQRGWDRDDDGSFDADENCWEKSC